jgi:hypothetical protein
VRFLINLLILTSACTGQITTPALLANTHFTPEPGLEITVDYALLRWIAATGLDLGTSDRGVPVWTQEEPVISSGGKQLCGAYNFVHRTIALNPSVPDCDYWSFESLVLHEIGHAITTSPNHSETGVMALGGFGVENRECIDLSSLELICAGADCEVMQPECY